MRNKFAALTAAMAALPGMHCNAAEAPSTTLRNEHITATIALPDSQKGYYRGTRFDWAGVVTSLKYKGHDYITPWSEINDPAVLDYEYRGEQIATGTSTTMVGVPEEFASLPERTAHGWEAAQPGGTFVKIGVGILRKPDDRPYDHFRLYDIVGGSHWDVEANATAVTFRQAINDTASGYGYAYTKKVALMQGMPGLVLEHTLRNTGNKALSGFVYNHNFMRWDSQTPGPDYSMHFAFDPKPADPLGTTPLVYQGRIVKFTRPVTGTESVRSLPVGFGNEPKDYDFRFEHQGLGIGLRVTADQPLYRAVIWGIRSVFAIEPFIRYDIQPGQQFSWAIRYQAYELPHSKQ